MNTTHTAQDIARWLSDHVEWNRFFSLVDGIGDTLNGFKNRFDKSDLLEQSLEVYSNGLLRWVDRLGTDLEMPDGTTIEMKYSEDCLYGKRGLRDCVKDLQLLNSRGSGLGRGLPDTYASFLLICDRQGVAVVDRETLSEFVVGVGDGIKTKGLRTNRIALGPKRDSTLTEARENTSDYLREKREMQRRFISMF